MIPYLHGPLGLRQSGKHHGEWGGGLKMAGIKIGSSIHLRVVTKNPFHCSEKIIEIIHEHIKKNEFHEHHKIRPQKGPKPLKNPSIRVN